MAVKSFINNFCMNIFQKKEEIPYWIAGAILIVVIFLCLFVGVRFIAKELNVALNAGLLKKPEIARFNLDQIEKLGIRRVE